MHQLCQKCDGACCKNLAMIIGRPINKKEVEDLKWQLQFDRVKVYIRNRRWHQLIESDCMYLTKDGRCKIYDQRPDRCRKYTQENCEYHGDFHDIMFETPQDLEDYLFKEKERRRMRKKSQKKR